jgi:monofunctional biosynthetic peptidoglycan transglycosylase
MFRFFLYLFIALTSLVGLVVVACAWVLITTPRPTAIRSCFVTPWHKVRMCPNEPTYTRSKEISPTVKMAVIASEDSGFYSHHGIDWFELKQSAEKNWTQGHFVRGGSTLTQQLAKNLYLGPEKSLLRKGREALIALQIEKILSKDEILEKYLNVVEFGPDVYGIRQAASYYFAKSPKQLTVAEGAFLAFLLPSPKKYSASFRKKQLTPFARKEIKNIIFRLMKWKKISESEYDQALNQVENVFGSAPSSIDSALSDDGEEYPVLDTETIPPSQEIPSDDEPPAQGRPEGQ